MSEKDDEPTPGRTERKRQAILDAATELFLRNGFRRTSMDEVATRAGVSKQTVYKQFTDKERLFRDIVEGVASNSDAVIATLTSAFGDSAAASSRALEARLRGVALVYLDAVLNPRVLSLRRLIIAEADAFPDLARSYYDYGPGQGVEVVAQCLQPYIDAGLLVVNESRLAAAHFAYLALGPALDRAQFMPDDLPDSAERQRLSAAAAAAFVAAYGA